MMKWLVVTFRILAEAVAVLFLLAVIHTILLPFTEGMSDGDYMLILYLGGILATYVLVKDAIKILKEAFVGR